MSGITGDFSERLESFAKNGSAAQRAADKVIHDQIEKKIEAKVYRTLSFKVTVENIHPGIRHDYRVTNAICEGATELLRRRFELSQYEKINVVVEAL